MPSTEPRARLLLARHADTAWREEIRPWLEGSHRLFTRSYVVVPTRGQAQGLKQRCVIENLPLLGVEFLSPGSARRKTPALATGTPALGRELLLFQLRLIIRRRLESLPADAPGRGLLKSLLSDAERARDDFDELLKANTGAAGFGDELVREVFNELSSRTEDLGYTLGFRESAKAALDGDSAATEGRLLVYGFGVETSGEFFNVAAFARRFSDVTVILPDPEFSGRRTLDEDWVALWENVLGAEPLPIDEPTPVRSCEFVASWWGASVLTESAPEGAALPRLLVGRTRAEEMRLVADEVVRLLAAGAGEIGVVFPKSGVAHALLRRLLADRAVPFVDLLPGVAALPREAQLQRALLTFYSKGGRIDELLGLWSLLRADGLVQVAVGEARRVCEKLFAERQTHALPVYLEALSARNQPAWKEVHRIAELLLPAWSAQMTLGDAIGRFEALCTALLLTLPPGWASLQAFALRETQALPLEEVIAVLQSFVPEKSPAVREAQPGFARVTLTTRRRAEGLAWTHIIFTESNAGAWPLRQVSSGWLTDEQRAKIVAQSGFMPGLLTSDDRAWLEKRSYAALARDTNEQVIFSAALAEESGPETPLAPNAWLERVLWHSGVKDGDLRARLCVTPVAREVKSITIGLKEWRAAWNSRRDPLQPFDEFFLSVDPAKLRPGKLAARLIEAAVGDPAELWFGAVLDCRRVELEPLMRSASLMTGQLAHRIIAKALRGEQREGVFFPKPERQPALQHLDEELLSLRASWPADSFWDSFHACLSRTCRVLLENLFSIDGGGMLATEVAIPSGAQLEMPDGCKISLSGRMDVVIADHTGWAGARVEIVDFKTGNDHMISADHMAKSGASLQLGIYLEAARQLGACDGRVWMVKPEIGAAGYIEMAELPIALSPVKQVVRHLMTGSYGALTPDRSRHASSRPLWPLACVPVPEVVLKRKFTATFGDFERIGEGGTDE